MSDQESPQGELNQEQAKPDGNDKIDFEALPEEFRESVKGRIGHYHRELKTLESKSAKELKAKDAELREIKAKLLEMQKPKEVALPTEDDFLADPAAAQQRINDHIESRTQMADWERQNKQYEEELQRQQQEAFKIKVQAFSERAINSGFDANQMAFAENGVANALAAVSPHAQAIGDYLLSHNYGPQLVKELHDNPAVLNEIASLDAMSAGVKLHELSKKFEPNLQSKAPDPVEPLNGAGAQPTTKYDRFIGKGRFTPS